MSIEAPLPAAERSASGKARAGRPTMVEVAALAGVSQTTVSLVLNGALEARISKETRQRVLGAAKSLGYKLAKRGTSIATDVDKTVVGFVVDEISTDPWMALALDGVREKAWEYGLTVSVAVTRGNAEMEEAVYSQMAGQPLLGLIYGTIQTRQIDASPALHRIPTVLLNCYVADRSIASIVPGEVLGGRTATERLIRSGHRRIGLIQGEDWMDASRDRLKGYRQALESHRDSVRPAVAQTGQLGTVGGLRPDHCPDGPCQPALGDFLLERSDGARLLRGAEGIGQANTR